MKEWNNFKDKKPPKHTPLLCYTAYGDMLVATLNPGKKWNKYWSDKEYVYDEDVTVPITHWMELPGNPK